jgi:hypothetical protein
MGRVVERKRLSADSERDDPLKERGKDAFSLAALTRSHFTALRRLIELYPPKSAQEQQGRKNSHNGVSEAWYREWSRKSNRPT